MCWLLIRIGIEDGLKHRSACAGLGSNPRGATKLILFILFLQNLNFLTCLPFHYRYICIYEIYKRNNGKGMS